MSNEMAKVTNVPSRVQARSADCPLAGINSPTKAQASGRKTMTLNRCESKSIDQIPQGSYHADHQYKRVELDGTRLNHAYRLAGQLRRPPKTQHHAIDHADIKKLP